MKLLSVILFTLLFSLSTLATEVTVSSFALNNWRYGGTTASLRMYASNQFVTSDSKTVVASPRVLDQSFYAKVNCTISGTTITCPTFVIDSTTDSSNPNARYQFVFWDYRNERKDSIGNIRVPATPNPTTLSALLLYNQSDIVADLSTTYSKAEIDALLADLSTAPNASEVIFGKSKLTVAPVDPNNPLAVGDNDPRLADLPVADSSTTVKGKVKLTTAPTDPANPLAVSNTDPRITKSLSLDYSNSLASAVSSIGSSTNTLLLVSQDTTVSTSVTVPKNIFIKTTGGAKFLKSGSGTITFQGQGISKEVGRVDLFSSFSVGDISFSGVPPDEIYPEWFGAVADNSTDSLAAFNKMFASLNGEPQNPQNSGAGHKRGGAIRLATGIYYLSDTLKVIRKVRMYGAGGTYLTPLSSLRFPKNVVGISTEGQSTLTGSYDSTKTSGFSTFENFGIYGAASDNNAVIDASGLTITLKNTGAITQVSQRGDNSNAAIKSFPNASTVSIGNGIVLVADSVSIETGTSTFTVKKPRFWVEANGTTTLRTNTTANFAGFVGATVRINGVNYTVTSGTTTNFTVNTAVPVFFGTATFQTIPTLTDSAARLNIYHGLQFKMQFVGENLRVYGFSGNGFNMNSEIRPTAALGGEPNLNYSSLKNCSAEFNEGNGFHVNGVNTQPMLFESLNADENKGWGYAEVGTSGVTNISMHTNNNQNGSYGMFSDIGASTLILPYTEGGMPSAIISQGTTVINPIWGNGSGVDIENSHNNVLSSNEQIQSGSGFVFKRNVDYYRTILNPKAFKIQIGSSNTPNTLFGFGAAEDYWNVANGNAVTNPSLSTWLFGYDQLYTGWYSLYYGGSHSTDQANSAIALSGYTSAEGGGKLMFKNGFYAGNRTGTRRNWQFVSAIPTTGVAYDGDVWWNNGSGAGVSQPLGWVTSAVGSLSATPAPIAFTVDASGVTNNVFTTATPHGFTTGMPITFSGASLPTINGGAAINGGTRYIIALSATTFRITSSTPNAYAGTPVWTLDNAGSGTITAVAGEVKPIYVSNQAITSNSASLDFTALASQTCEELDITGFSSLTTGDVVSLGLPVSLTNNAGAVTNTVFNGFVKNSTTVTVRRCNLGSATTFDPTSATVRAKVTKF